MVLNLSVISRYLSRIFEHLPTIFQHTAHTRDFTESFVALVRTALSSESIRCDLLCAAARGSSRDVNGNAELHKRGAPDLLLVRVDYVNTNARTAACANNTQQITTTNL